MNFIQLIGSDAGKTELVLKPYLVNVDHIVRIAYNDDSKNPYTKHLYQMYTVSFTNNSHLYISRAEAAKLFAKIGVPFKGSTPDQGKAPEAVKKHYIK